MPIDDQNELSPRDSSLREPSVGRGLMSVTWAGLSASALGGSSMVMGATGWGYLEGLAVAVAVILAITAGFALRNAIGVGNRVTA